jgi:hypothetical protein
LIGTAVAAPKREMSFGEALCGHMRASCIGRLESRGILLPLHSETELFIPAKPNRVRRNPNTSPILPPPPPNVPGIVPESNYSQAGYRSRNYSSNGDLDHMFNRLNELSMTEIDEAMDIPYEIEKRVWEVMIRFMQDFFPSLHFSSPHRGELMNQPIMNDPKNLYLIMNNHLDRKYDKNTFEVKNAIKIKSAEDITKYLGGGIHDGTREDIRKHIIDLITYSVLQQEHSIQNPQNRSILEFLNFFVQEFAQHFKDLLAAISDKIIDRRDNQRTGYYYFAPKDATMVRFHYLRTNRTTEGPIDEMFSNFFQRLQDLLSQERKRLYEIVNVLRRELLHRHRQRLTGNNNDQSPIIQSPVAQERMMQQRSNFISHSADGNPQAVLWSWTSGSIVEKLESKPVPNIISYPTSANHQEIGMFIIEPNGHYYGQAIGSITGWNEYRPYFIQAASRLRQQHATTNKSQDSNEENDQKLKKEDIPLNLVRDKVFEDLSVNFSLAEKTILKDPVTGLTTFTYRHENFILTEVYHIYQMTVDESNGNNKQQKNDNNTKTCCDFLWLYVDGEASV